MLLATLAYAQGVPGIALFEARCAQCHAAPGLDNRAPNREALRQRSPEFILDALTTGAMMENARDLSETQRRVLAEYLSGRPLGSMVATATSMPNKCPATPLVNPFKGTMWNGWSPDTENTRFQPTAAAGLTLRQVPLLKLKWAFGFPHALSMYGQPTVVGNRVYIGADTGFVYSLSADTGCVYWSFQADAGVRTAMSVGALTGERSGRFAVYFGDVKANVYAVDAASGELLWKQLADPHPIARITGSPLLSRGTLYVPVSSLEEIAGATPTYPCCTFRGSVVAYEAETGRQIWKSFMIPEEPRPIKKTSMGTQLWAPAGAAIWSAPTLDLKRQVLYVGTGDAYTSPAAPTSDAVVALDLKTGRMVWSKQLFTDDAFLSGPNCRGTANPRSETCPEENGPDFDFGSSPMLQVSPDGSDLILIGQKSGIAWALDPGKKGEIVWSHRVGKGSALGGIEFGSATDGKLVYFPNADARYGPAEAGGLAALGIRSGEQVWFKRPPPVPCAASNDPKCNQAQAAAITVIPGVIFSGTTNGMMRAYGADDGRIVWEFNSAREFETVNGVPAAGGGINGPGPVVVGGKLFVTSGYAALGNGLPGNVLLMFSADDR